MYNTKVKEEKEEILEMQKVKFTICIFFANLCKNIFLLFLKMPPT